MVSLLKTFGKGILYVIGFPFFLAALLLFGVIGLFAFLFQLIKSIIYFFTGQKFFPELPEDKQLRLMREGPEEKKEAEPEPDIVTPVSEPKQQKETAQSVYPFAQEPIEEPVPEEEVFRNIKSSSVEEACFQEDPHDEVELAEEEEDEQPDLSSLLNDDSEEEEDISLDDSSIEEIDEQETTEEEETLLETSVEQEEEEEFEELETYVPGSSNYSNDVLDDDDDTDDEGGVDIKYDL